MKILIFYGAFSALLSGLLCQFYDQEINSDCTSEMTGSNGTCVEAKDCPEFKTLREKLKICSFKHRVPIVCCPRQSTQKRISAQKCEEYATQRHKSAHTVFVRSVPDNDDGLFHVTVVGGTKTFPNEFPHMSAIGWQQSDGEIAWRCGGSLISENFVLSAAHCANAFDGKPSAIRIGDKDLQDPNDGANPQQFTIRNIIVHPKYKRNQKYHDLALFELDRNARFDESVLPACINQPDEDLSNRVPTAMGWGQTSFAGKASNSLLKVDLNMVTNEECNKSYKDEQELPEGITDAQICAGDSEGDRDTCQCDSGGPLQVTKFVNSSIVYEVIGVTSFGKFCAAGVPGVYVRVSSYIDWIESVVWPNGF